MNCLVVGNTTSVVFLICCTQVFTFLCRFCTASVYSFSVSIDALFISNINTRLTIEELDSLAVSATSTSLSWKSVPVSNSLSKSFKTRSRFSLLTSGIPTTEDIAFCNLSNCSVALITLFCLLTSSSIFGIVAFSLNNLTTWSSLSVFLYFLSSEVISLIVSLITLEVVLISSDKSNAPVLPLISIFFKVSISLLFVVIIRLGSI